MTRNHKKQEFRAELIKSIDENKAKEANNFITAIKIYSSIFDGKCRYEDCYNDQDILATPLIVKAHFNKGELERITIPTENIPTMALNSSVCFFHIKEDFEILKNAYPEIINFEFESFYAVLGFYATQILEKQQKLKSEAKERIFPSLINSLNDYFKKNSNQFNQGNFLEWY